MIKTASILAIAGTLIGTANAGDCHVVQQRVVVQKTFVQSHVVQPQIVHHQQLGFQSFVPLIYGTGYNDNYGSKALEEILELFRLQAEEQKFLRERLQQLESGKVAPVKKEDHLDILVKNCAACHTEGKTKDKNNIELFSVEGDFFKANKFTTKAIVDAINSGSMPPDGTMTEVDRMTVKKGLLGGK